MRVPIHRTKPPSGKRPQSCIDGPCNGANARSSRHSCESTACVDDDNPGHPTSVSDIVVVNGRVNKRASSMRGIASVCDNVGVRCTNSLAGFGRTSRSGICALSLHVGAHHSKLQEMTISKRRKGITTDDNVIEHANIDDAACIDKLSCNCAVFT